MKNWTSVRFRMLAITAISITIASLSVGCTRSMDEPTSLKIKLPDPQFLKTSDSVSAQTASWGYTEPRAMNEVSCYLIFVGGPETSMSNQSCKDSSGAELFRYSGAHIYGMLTPSYSLVLKGIPTGLNREVVLLGVSGASSPTDCIAFGPNGPAKSSYSNPVILSQAKIDLVQGDNLLTMTASISPKIVDDCSWSSAPPGDDEVPQPIVSAVLTNLPEVESNQTSITVTVSGTDVATYKYALGGASLDCSLDTIYGSDTNVSVTISETLGADGNFKLCVIAAGTDGTYQPTSSAIVHSWLKDTVAPTASLGAPLTGVNNLTSLNHSVTGNSITHYRYALGPAGLDCTVLGNYGSEYSIVIPITETLAADGSQKLCVIGKDTAGNFQSAASSSQFTWAKDTTSPTATLSGPPADPNNDTALNVSVAGTGVTHYKYALGNSSLDCNLSGNYSSELPIGTNITDALVPEGEYILCVIGRDAAGNYQPEASNTTYTFTKLSPKFIDVTTGSNFSCGLTGDGKVYCWGTDASGQLGAGAGDQSSNIPVLVDTTNISGEKSVKQIVAGSNYACLLTVEGAPYCWGSDTNGVLGNNAGGDTQLPGAVDLTNLSGVTTVAQLSAGPYTMCLLTGDGLSYCWGGDFNGTLGNGGADTESQLPVAVDTTNLSTGSRFKSISLGSSHACGLTGSGDIFCWGSDSIGQVGNGGTTGNQNIPVAVDTTNVSGLMAFIELSVGEVHACAMTADGKTYCWGRGNSGQLGDSANSNVSLPSLMTMGSFANSQVPVKLFAGGDVSCAVTGDRRPYCWGEDSSDQLGNGAGATSLNVATAVDLTGVSGSSPFQKISIGGFHSCGLTEGGEIYCWGLNPDGRLGDGTTTGRASPTAINTNGLIGVKGFSNKLGSGDSHTCGVALNGKPFCWGWNAYGQLGVGVGGTKTLPFALDLTNFTNPTGVIDIGGVWKNGYLINLLGQLMGWGEDGMGEVGNGAGTNSNLPVLTDDTSVVTPKTFKEIAEGGGYQVSHSCAIATNGKLYCWGADNDGQLGNGGASTNSLLPIPIDETPIAGDKAFVDVGVGISHSCGLTPSGAVYCWGSDVNGQLGAGGGDQSSQSPVAVNLGALGTGVKPTSLAVGKEHACLLTNYGSVYCWGRGNYGQVGNSSTATQQAPVLISTTNFVASEATVQLSAGTSSSCAITSAGRSLCWGWNNYGAIGDGTTTNRTYPVVVNVTGVAGDKSLRSVIVGGVHACALAADAKLYCWGRNFYGQIGDSSTTDRLTPTATDLTNL